MLAGNTTLRVFVGGRWAMAWLWAPFNSFVSTPPTFDWSNISLNPDLANTTLWATPLGNCRLLGGGRLKSTVDCGTFATLYRLDSENGILLMWTVHFVRSHRRQMLNVEGWLVESDHSGSLNHPMYIFDRDFRQPFRSLPICRSWNVVSVRPMKTFVQDLKSLV